jgi:chondroitin AC lyase
MKKKQFLQAFTLVAAVCMSSAAWSQTLISTNQPVTVSSTESASYPASNAVDGNTVTSWSSASTNFNQWLYVDLGTIRDIDKVEIVFADGRYATTLDIMVSNDANTWITINAIASGNTSSTVTFAALGAYGRYVKFNGRGRANTAGYRIAEFKVYTPAAMTATQQSEVNTVRDRLIAHHAGTEPTNLTVYINAMQPNGQFSNIDYSGTGWTRHALYLNRIANAYTTPSNVSYQDATIPGKVMLGMRHLLNVHYISSNWHDTQVRVPNNLLTSLMLMVGHIPQDSIITYTQLINDYTFNTAQKGANRAWVSINVVRKGLLTNRYDVVQKGYLNVVKGLTLTAVNDDEGVMIDNSFHQHHDQLQTGGYGKDLIEDEVVYLRMARGTSLESYFDATYRSNLRNMMLGGLQIIGYRGNVDFGSVGRGVSAPNGIATMSAALIDTQKLNDAANAAAYEYWRTHVGGGNFPGAYFGTKYFWKSAILTSHGSNFYLSAKVISTRTEGTEQLNGENLKGYNLPLGATNIMTTGTEYYDIFPTWNWSRIPGTTSEMSEADSVVKNGFTNGYLTGTNDFGGGLAHADDGVIAYEHNYKNLSAKKAYFFMDSMMVCMGNSIVANKTNEVVTTINQTKSVGPITYNSETTTLSADSLTSSALQWVHHNNVGYLFPYGGYFSLTNKTQTGNWKSLATGGTSAVQSNLMFNLYVRHSPTPNNRTYFYIVAPGKQAGEMSALAVNHGFVRVANTSSVQAIQDTNTKKYAVVFYAAGEVTMPDGLVVRSDKKALVFIKKYAANYRISVADPVYTGSPIVITLNKELSGAGTVYSNGETAITFTMPSGDEKGKTVTGFYPFEEASRVAANPEQRETPGNEKVVVYPNPASSILNISGVSGDAVIEVYDQSGRRCKTAKGKAINVSGLVAGASYWVRISDGGTVITKQFVKQ